MTPKERQANVSERRDPGTGAFDWSRVAPRDEPTRHRSFWVGVGTALLFGTPWWQPEALAQKLVFGLPFWVVTSLVGAMALAMVTCFAALRWWSDEEPGADGRAGEGPLP